MVGCSRMRSFGNYTISGENLGASVVFIFIVDGKLEVYSLLDLRFTS